MAPEVAKVLEARARVHVARPYAYTGTEEAPYGLLNSKYGIAVATCGKLYEVAASTKEIFRPSREEKRAKLSHHFVEAIEPMLEKAPYSDLQVEAVIKAGGISRATFYSYFSDKVDLLQAMVEAVVEDLHLVAFWRIPDGADKDQLREALGRVASTYREHRLLMRALVEGASYDARLRDLYDGVVGQGVQNAATHIREGQKKGNIEPALDPDETARLLVYMGEHALYRVIGVSAQPDDGAFVDALTEVFWRTLYNGYR